METIEWYTSKLDCGTISYRASKRDDGKFSSSLTVKQVVFERFNTTAHVTEEVMVHWSNAFKWADYDPCGGLGVTAVILSDGSRCFASGRYFREGGMAAVHVGCYGDAWLKRDRKPERDEHGFPIRKAVAA